MNKLFPAVFAALFGAPVAQALDTGFYVGGGIGYADVLTDDDEDDVADFLADRGLTANIDNDTDNFNWRLFGGWQFHPNFGIETGYLALGELDVDAAIPAPTNARVKVEAEIDGFEFVATGAYPVGYGIELTARLGGIYWDADADVDITGPITGTFNADDDGVAFTGGIGFARQFGTNWIWRGGWQYVDTDRVENLGMTSIAYRFGGF